jgi:hypothetical protein
MIPANKGQKKHITCTLADESKRLSNPWIQHIKFIKIFNCFDQKKNLSSSLLFLNFHSLALPSGGISHLCKPGFHTGKTGGAKTGTRN